MRTTMVSCEENKIVSTSQLRIKCVEKTVKFAVQLNVGIVDFRAACTVNVADNVGRRDAHGQHIGLRSQPQPLILQGSLGHIEGQRDTLRRTFHVKSFHLLVRLVELFHPRRQLVHVVCARDEAAFTRVPPVGCVGTMACRQDCGTVFESHPHHFRLEIRGKFQLIAYR